MPVTPLTRDTRRARTRTHLLEAAAEVFARRGFHAATLDDIAETAGFSKGALYFHFTSKEDLYLALNQERGAERITEYFGAAGSRGSDSESIADALTEISRRLAPDEQEWVLSTEFALYALRDPELRKKQAALRQETIDAVTTTLERVYGEAGIDLPLAAPLLARLFVAVFSGFAEQRALDGPAVDKDALAEALTFMHRCVEALARAQTRPRQS